MSEQDSTKPGNPVWVELSGSLTSTGPAFLPRHAGLRSRDAESAEHNGQVYRGAKLNGEGSSEALSPKIAR